MPTVRVRVAHINLGAGTISRGQTQHVDAGTAAYLIASGAVELVRDTGPATPEQGTISLEKAQRPAAAPTRTEAPDERTARLASRGRAPARERR